MRITEVNIPKVFEDNGIENLKMNRLGQIVVLVGKNGAGKTRILTKIQHGIRKWVFESQAEEYKTRIEIAEQHIINYKQAIENYNNNNKDIKEAFRKENIKNFKNSITHYQEEINKYVALLENSSIFNTDVQSQLQSITFIPKSPNIKAPNGFNQTQINNATDDVKDMINADLSSHTLAYIKRIQDLYYVAIRNENKDNPTGETNIAHYKNLKGWVKLFLDTELGSNIEGDPTLFGRSINDLRLSDGQAILLQLCVALYNQSERLGKYILLIDEPENHIHPSAIIEALEKIVEVTKESQIWIATHSIPIIAYLASNPETSIWYVEEGKVSFAGSEPERVLKGLLGDEEQISKLHDFIGLPAQYAINLYAYQCLFAPAVAMTGNSDPQTNQIREILNGLVKEGESLKILDYGAGKGRLLANILETDERLIKQTEYVAFDEYTTYSDNCKSLIELAYGNSEKKYYDNIQQLKADHKETFHVIIMCNVLHEIDPKEWIELFQKKLSSLLCENGVLLIVEDSEIPIGEKAYQNGFIVFDAPQIQTLFKITAKDKGFISQQSPNNARLKAHLVPKKYLLQITTETKKEALTSLNDEAKEKIKGLRGGGTDYKTGRQHAFWVQQFANTQLALNEI